MRHRASQAFGACLHHDKTSGDKAHGHKPAGVYSRNHVRYASHAAIARPSSTMQGQPRSAQYAPSDSLTRAESSQRLLPRQDGFRRPGSSGDKKVSSKSSGLYSIQTIFQDDTIAPIDEEQSTELREMNSDSHYHRPKLEPLAKPNGSDINPAKTTFSAAVWNSMASRFTPLKTSERHAQIDNAFEDDTITPLDESPITTVELNDLLARQQMVQLVRSYARSEDGQEQYRRFRQTGRVDLIESAQTSRRGSSQHHASGHAPGSDATLKSLGASTTHSTLSRRPTASRGTCQTLSLHHSPIRASKISPPLRTAASSPSFNLPTLPPHSMPPAARELVREAIENISSGTRSPSRLSRSHSYQTPSCPPGETTDLARQHRHRSPPTTAPSAHSRGGIFWASSSSDAGLTSQCEDKTRSSEGGVSAATTLLQTSPSVTAVAVARSRPATAPCTAKVEQVSPISASNTARGHIEQSGTLWIDGHWIERSDAGGKD